MRVVMTDDLVSGTSNRGRMSPVRRFFVLLCTFDVLFICLLWIIAILVTGRDLVQELHQQVVEYTIHSSMFDCVLVALTRWSSRLTELRILFFTSQVRCLSVFLRPHLCVSLGPHRHHHRHHSRLPGGQGLSVSGGRTLS